MVERGRRPFDFYETPPHYIAALRDVIGPLKGKHVYEPCAGDGCIVRGFPDARWTTNDWDPARTAARTHYNATRGNGRAWGTLGFEWCVTNPPFEAELPILENALRWCKNVAMLARLSFLEPTEDRRPFWAERAASCTVIVLPRYSFRLNDEGKRQTDSMTCCWLVWWSAQSVGHLHVSQRKGA